MLDPMPGRTGPRGSAVTGMSGRRMLHAIFVSLRRIFPLFPVSLPNSFATRALNLTRSQQPCQAIYIQWCAVCGSTVDEDVGDDFNNHAWHALHERDCLIDTACSMGVVAIEVVPIWRVMSGSLSGRPEKSSTDHKRRVVIQHFDVAAMTAGPRFDSVQLPRLAFCIGDSPSNG